MDTSEFEIRCLAVGNQQQRRTALDMAWESYLELLISVGHVAKSGEVAPIESSRPVDSRFLLVVEVGDAQFDYRLPLTQAEREIAWVEPAKEALKRTSRRLGGGYPSRSILSPNQVDSQRRAYRAMIAGRAMLAAGQSH